MLYYSLYSFLLGSPTSPNSMYTTTILPSLIWWLRDFGVGGLLESNLGLLLRPSTVARGNASAVGTLLLLVVRRSQWLAFSLSKVVCLAFFLHSREARSKKPLVYIRYQEIDFSLELFLDALFFVCFVLPWDWRGSGEGRRGGEEALFWLF